MFIDSADVTFVTNDVDSMMLTISLVGRFNQNLKEVKGESKTEVVFPTHSRDLGQLWGVQDQIDATFECPRVSYNMSGGKITLSGPATQVAIAAEYFQRFGKSLISHPSSSAQKSKPKKSKTVVDLGFGSDSEYKSSTKAAVSKAIIAESESEYKAVVPNDGSVDGLVDGSADGSESESEDEPKSLAYTNRMVRPPSKAETARMKKAASSGAKRSNYDDYSATEDQAYAIITQLYGGSRVGMRIISIGDDKYNTIMTGRISGAMSRRNKEKKIRGANRLAANDVVVVAKREFGDIYDIIYKVPEDGIRVLIRKGEISRDYQSAPTAEKTSNGFTFSAHKKELYDDCPFEFADEDDEDEEEIDFSTI